MPTTGVKAGDSFDPLSAYDEYGRRVKPPKYTRAEMNALAEAARNADPNWIRGGIYDAVKKMGGDPGVASLASTVGNFVPFVGDAADAEDAARAFGDGDYLTSALLAAALIAPGAAGKLVKGAGKQSASEAGQAVAKRGDEILDMLKSGKASQVTDSMLDLGDAAKNAELNRYLYQNYDLPMDEASRMARADALYPNKGYHGSTHTFDKFGGGKTHNAEGHFGAGTYVTTSPEDAVYNYAGEGPDLTNRVQQRAEMIASELGLDYDAPEALEAARKELVGDNLGTVYPVRVGGNVADVRPKGIGNPTALEVQMPSAEDFLDEARRELPDGADYDDVYDLAQEMADDAWGDAEPKGGLADFVTSIRDNAERYDYDADEALAPIIDDYFGGYITADNLDKSLREGSLAYAEDMENGGMVVGDVIRQAFKDSGYDTLQMDALSSFPNMKNIPDGTSHFIASNPANLRSEYARFDPRLKHLSNLNAALATALLGAGAMRFAGEDDEEM